MIIGNFSAKSNKMILQERAINKNLASFIDDISIIPIGQICPDAIRVKDSLYKENRRHAIEPQLSAPGPGEPEKNMPDTIQRKSVDTIISYKFNFSFDSHKLLNEEEIDSLANYFTGDPIQKIKIVGYTDTVGSVEYNIDLSVRRANEIKQLTSAKFRIPSSLFEVEGRGKSDLFNQANENRRVEIYIYR